MPTYMDRHDNVTVTPEELAGAHAMDVAVQAKHGVNYLSYWYDRDAECVFCFVDAPSKAAAEAVHREAHGLVAPARSSRSRARHGHELPRRRCRRTRSVRPHADTAFRTILFTDIVGSTDLTQRLGDAKAMELLRVHDLIVRTELVQVGGNEVKHTGDGIMASFASVARAIECAIAIQRALDEHSDDRRAPDQRAHRRERGRARRRARRPVRRRRPARARACDRAAAGAILVSTAVRELCVGKGFTFEPRGAFELKGFEELSRPPRSHLARLRNRHFSLHLSREHHERSGTRERERSVSSRVGRGPNSWPAERKRARDSSGPTYLPASDDSDLLDLDVDARPAGRAAGASRRSCP